MNRRSVLTAGLCVGVGALLCAFVVAVVSSRLSAGPAEDARARFDTQLAVQKALQDGLDQLQRGNHAAAVATLEKEIARIDGNRKYLDALASAYRGYIRDLQQSNRGADAEMYRKRLAILDPTPDGQPVKLVEKPTPTPEPKPVAALPSVPEPIKLPAPPPVIARGKFDDAPVKTEADHGPEPARKANPTEAAALVERATQEFSQKHYPEAGRYYEQAHKLDSGATASSLEQWAFCKVYTVSAALQHGSPNSAAAQDLEREIQQALAMAPNAPKLAIYANALRKDLRERTTPTAAGTAHIDEDAALEMRHLPAEENGWAAVVTKNFRILHNQPKEVAERAARVAEGTRLAMSRKWFGDDGETWNARCDIYLYATADDYSRATKTDSRSPGHSTMDTDKRDGIVTSRRIDLHVDHPETFGSVLPHEATHVVLAGRFGGVPVPRWADEGMAVLTEPPHRVERYLRNLPRHDQDHVLFEIGRLMRMDDYPEARLVDPFYTQSISVVDFLSKEKGPQVFTAFLRDGLRSGFEPALRKHYKIESFAELDRRWRAFAFAEPTK